MQIKPLVSIIIPTYNRSQFLGVTLDSVLAQTYLHWECIVVDDGSTDDTEALLQSYIEKDSRFQYHKRPDNHLPGGNGARNFGFEVSKGVFIQWFDDDDIMLSDFLRQKVKLLVDSINLVICSGHYGNQDLHPYKTIDLRVDTTLYNDYVYWTLHVFTPCVLFRKAFLKSHELFREELQRAQEAEFFSRLFYKMNPNDYEILNEPLFLYRQHEQSKTEINKVYNPSYRQSEAYYFIENLKRSLQLQEPKLCRFLFHKTIALYIDALKHRDHTTAKQILQALQPLLTEHQKFFKQLQLLRFLYIGLSLKSYRLEKHIRDTSLKLKLLS